MKVALYARFSSSKQREASIEDQLRTLEARARQEGWEVVARFADAAISGKTTERPEYQRMIRAADAKQFDIILVERLDRLFRSLEDQERVLNQLEDDGIRVVGNSDGYDSSRKDRKLSRALHGAINEDESEKIGQRTIRGQEGQARKGFLAGGKPYGFDLVPIRSGTERDQFGEPVRVGTVLRPNKQTAKIVREIFKRFVDGESERHIAGVLNARKIASPGSTWNRTIRRASGWQGSAINAILRNEAYNGRLVWNKTKWKRDRKTGIRKKKLKPRSEWFTHVDEQMRIVSPELWEATLRRFKVRKTALHTGGAGRGHKGSQGPKYLLSGLLKCGACGAQFIIAGKDSYACSSFINGKACKNTYRLNRLDAEEVLLEEMRRKLLEPKMVARMAEELRAEYEARLRERAKDKAAVPKEVRELDTRLERLRRRLRNGDPDMTPEDIQAAIERAEAEKLRLLHQNVSGQSRPSAKIYAALPQAAKLYERQIARGLGGNLEQSGKARALLRDLFGGPVTLTPTAKGLVARSALHKDVVLKEPDGSGGRI